MPCVPRAAMGAGTLSGGWRIVKHDGHGPIFRHNTIVGGFSAETAGATTFMATFLGIPVPGTTQSTAAHAGRRCGSAVR